MQISSFIFDSYTIDLPNKILSFFYTVKKDEEVFTFEEKIFLPKEVKREVPPLLLNTIVAQLHLVLGLSYWKLFCPSDIVVKSVALQPKQAQFWNTLYTKGLGEFFYRNTIDFRDLISFPQSAVNYHPVSLHGVSRCLVGIGGGKDSVVSIEFLNSSQKQYSGYSLLKETLPLIDETAQTAGIENLFVQRVLDPQLATLSRSKSAYNGHVPVSAIYAFVGVLLAILYDFTYVIASNEQSANYGNVHYLGEVVNHQWSKSIEFEKMFREYIHEFVTPDVTYFSLLRPWNEIAIAKAFCQYPPYFSIFSSCNRNFSSTHPNQEGRKWCGDCPKCAFVFALLAAFLPKETVTKIFGENLFAKETLLPLYKELLGIEGFKPFECVGTPEETKVAFYLASLKGEYTNDYSMKFFISQVLPHISDIEKLKATVFQRGDDSLIPESFKKFIDIP